MTGREEEERWIESKGTRKMDREKWNKNRNVKGEKKKNSTLKAMSMI